MPINPKAHEPPGLGVPPPPLAPCAAPAGLAPPALPAPPPVAPPLPVVPETPGAAPGPRPCCPSRSPGMTIRGPDGVITVVGRFPCSFAASNGRPVAASALRCDGGIAGVAPCCSAVVVLVPVALGAARLAAARRASERNNPFNADCGRLCV